MANINLIELPSCSSESQTMSHIEENVESEPQVSEDPIEDSVEMEPQVSEVSNNDSIVSIYDDSVEWSSPMPEAVECSDVDWRPNVNNITVSNEVRRSERLANKPERSYNFCAVDFVSNDPSRVKNAMTSEKAVKWKNAMQDEMKSLIENNTWILVNLPPGQKPVKSKWVFKTKVDDQGNPIRVKYVPTNEMPADMFTKAITPQKLNYFCNKFGLK